MERPDDRELASQLRSPHGDNAIATGEFMAKGNARLYHELFSLLDLKADDSILEIGPGNGTFVSEILGAHEKITYTSIDLSVEMTAKSTEINVELINAGKARILHGNFMEDAFGSEKFDHVIGINLIYFMNPISLFLKSVRAVMEKESRLYLGYRSRESMAMLPFTRFEFQLFEADDVETALKNEGFHSIKSSSFKEELKSPEGGIVHLDSIFTLASSP